jgi:hypothetical protein
MSVSRATAVPRNYAAADAAQGRGSRMGGWVDMFLGANCRVGVYRVLVVVVVAARRRRGAWNSSRGLGTWGWSMGLAALGFGDLWSMCVGWGCGRSLGRGLIGSVLVGVRLVGEYVLSSWSDRAMDESCSARVCVHGLFLGLG